MLCFNQNFPGSELNNGANLKKGTKFLPQIKILFGYFI